MSATTIVVNDETPKRQYTATGGQTIFDFPFPVFLDTDVTVYLTPVGQAANDANDLLTLTTNYTVTGANTQASCQVVLNSGATAGDIITITRVVDIARTTDYQVGGDLLAESLNKEQDLFVMMAQQLRSDLDRCIIIPETDSSGASLDLPAPFPDFYIKWNTAGDALESVAGTTPNAAAVPFVPTGNIAATDVQAALAELDTEKAASVHTHVEADITDLDKYTQAQVDAALALKLDTSTVGVTVQAYDADTAKTDVAQIFTAPQQGAVSVGTSLSIDLSLGNNHRCSPIASGTLTFTNLSNGQSGNIYLDNRTGYVISAAITTYIDAITLSTISSPGEYYLSYFCDAGAVFVSASRSLTGAGA